MKTVKVHEGKLDGTGLKIGIVVSRFNDFITRRLLDGCLDALTRHGASEDDIEIAYVPGCFEIPLAARKMAEGGRLNAVVALGTVIRGGTTHYEYVAGQVSRGVATVSLETGVPVIFGVVTTDNVEQAVERAGTRLTNRGFDAGVSAIEMAQVMNELDEG